MISVRLPVSALLLFGAAPPLVAAPDDNAAPVRKVESSELIQSLSGKTVDGATPEHEALLTNCPGQKFEAKVEVGTGTDKHLTKVKLCSRAGETREQWIVSLGEAAAKIQANDELAAESRAQLVAAINAEIARLKS